MSLFCRTAHFFIDYLIMKVHTPKQDFHLRIIMQKRNQNDRKIFSEFVVAIYAAELSFPSVPQLRIIPNLMRRVGYFPSRFSRTKSTENRIIVNSRFLFYFVLRLYNIKLFAPRFQKVVNYHYLARGLYLI